MFLLVALVSVWLAYFATLKSQTRSEIYSQRVKLTQKIDILRERRDQIRDFAADQRYQSKEDQFEYAYDIKHLDGEIAIVQSQLDALDDKSK
jgi:flagellar motility protein MotE (MotC chaperone)